MATERALDIFAVLKNIDIKNRGFYETLNEDQRKAFVPFVVMQWMACSNDDLQTLLINEYANKSVFKLYKHPGLLYKLLVCCSSGRQQFYKWQKQQKNITKYPKAVKLLQQHLGISTRQVLQVIHLVPNDELLMLACDYGYQKDAFTELQKELKTRI